ncbi:MAG: GMC family oxidoreductase N-terminal domain-containing protein [Rhizobiaceae bacterium]
MPGLEFDYIVIGAGSAGCVIADKLSESGSKSVLVLDAGRRGHPFERMPAGVIKLLGNPRADWCYASEPEENLKGRRVPVARGKLAGGSSAINGMIFARGQREDYDSWKKEGNSGWGYEDVLPLFKDLEAYSEGDGAYRGRTGPLAVTKVEGKGRFYDSFFSAGEEIGINHNPDYNGASQEGMALTQANIKNGRRVSAARAFLRPAMRRKNLTFQSGAVVNRLLFDGHRCIGVEYALSGTVRRARARTEVISSAGSINSPKLLELSGIGDQSILRKLEIKCLVDLPGVGENLIDHIGPRLTVRSSSPDVSFNTRSSGLWLAKNFLEYALLGKGPLAMPVAPLRAYIKTDTSPDRPNIGLGFCPYSVAEDGQLDQFPAMLATIHVLRPESRGSVHIVSADPGAAPRIRFNFFSAETDRTDLLEGFRVLQQLLASRAMSAIASSVPFLPIEEYSSERIMEWIRETSLTNYHPVGTCKMGSSDDAVVDEQLRVRGVSGLRIADASIMPTITSGNTNAPSMMIGAKAAQLIIQSQ